MKPLLESLNKTFSALATCEEEEFVDSIINMDHYDKEENQNENEMQKEIQSCDSFQDKGEMYSMINDVYGGAVSSLTMEGKEVKMMKGSFKDGADQQQQEVMMIMPSAEEANQQAVDQGLQLVHLLLACAEAVGCRDTKLASSILSQVWSSANPWGDSLQRVSYCFASALKSRLSLLQNVNASGTRVDSPLITGEEKMEAFQFLYQSTPYLAFGYMAANEAICQAAQGKESLHIIDLGMENSLQWPSLIRALASRPEGPPKVRITGLGGNNNNQIDLETGMKTLMEDASSLRIHLDFNIIPEPMSPSLLTKESLDLREGDALFVNSVMHLHKYVKESRGSLKAVLQAIRKLGPTLLTVVEQDATHNGPFFLGRFLESLHYYSAIFDSLEASLPRNSPKRTKIERVHFAEEIRNIVAYEGPDRIERHERADQWRRQLGRAGFQVVGLKCMSQARMMLSVYGCDGYTLATEKGCLLLGWKGRPIMLASAWQLNNVSSS
ncbi:Transcription factor GRAS [Dillenia turbinata]|uniref:Transcription factor GRAS n=1 Tax=Dillenia turbinata TaxID=194707 RepID=A0AAN8ZUE1_9MAGN